MESFNDKGEIAIVGDKKCTFSSSFHYLLVFKEHQLKEKSFYPAVKEKRSTKTKSYSHLHSSFKKSH